MVNPPDKRMNSYIQIMNSIEFKLDEDFTDNDMPQGRVATKSKERLAIE